MNNLLSYCGLVDESISASEKNLPIYVFNIQHIWIFLPNNWESGFYFGIFLRKTSKFLTAKHWLSSQWPKASWADSKMCRICISRRDTIERKLFSRDYIMRQFVLQPPWKFKTLQGYFLKLLFQPDPLQCHNLMKVKYVHFYRYLRTTSGSANFVI